MGGIVGETQTCRLIDWYQLTPLTYLQLYLYSIWRTSLFTSKVKIKIKANRNTNSTVYNSGYIYYSLTLVSFSLRYWMLSPEVQDHKKIPPWRLLEDLYLTHHLLILPQFCIEGILRCKNGSATSQVRRFTHLFSGKIPPKALKLLNKTDFFYFVSTINQK